jgi:predicted XRE-type DNA-binding protein
VPLDGLQACHIWHTIASMAPKPVIWMGDSLNVLREFPAPVQHKSGVCAARVSEEVNEGHRHPATGIGSRQGETEGGGGPPPQAGDKMMADKAYVVGSGNVFADLGVARPEEALAKAELAHKISEIIASRQLTQAKAAVLLRVDQPKISALKRGRLAGFSLDRLVGFLVLLGSDVEIVVKARPKSRRLARVMVA